MVDQAETAAAALKAVDQVEVLVLVDNLSDFLSTVPESVTSELPGLMRARIQSRRDEFQEPRQGHANPVLSSGSRRG